MKKMSLTEQITYSTVKLSCKLKDGRISNGTGFIIDLCENKEEGTVIPLLITNKHVIENSVDTTFEFCKKNEEGDPVDTETVPITVMSTLWNKHPDNSVDLVSLPLSEVINLTKKFNQNIFYISLDKSLIPSQNEINEFQAMEEVVMVGYPIGLMDYHNHKPIIRSGITATILKNDYQGNREFLIDMACFPGSSGSPIFIVNEGSYRTGKGLFIGSRIKLIGILRAGPMYSANGTIIIKDISTLPFPVVDIPINLGVVIKSERLLEIETFYFNLMEGQDND